MDVAVWLAQGVSCWHRWAVFGTWLSSQYDKMVTYVGYNN